MSAPVVLAFLIVILCTLPIMAQDDQGGPGLKGIVLDRQTKVPLAYANIYNSSNRKGTITDES